MLDAAADQADSTGLAPETVHTRVIAEHVLRLYLPQVRRYLAGTGDLIDLRQITNKRSVILGAVLRLHLEAKRHRCRSVAEIRSRLPDEYALQRGQA